MKQRVDMRIDVELLDRVDEARGEETRTAFTERALEAALYPPRVITSKAIPGNMPGGPLTVPKLEAESRTSPPDDPTALQRKIRAKMAKGRSSKLAEIEAREELGL